MVGFSLKFLLETRLQSESFDTLDDLLRFGVQKLWSKAVVLNWGSALPQREEISKGARASTCSTTWKVF